MKLCIDCKWAFEWDSVDYPNDTFCAYNPVTGVVDTNGLHPPAGSCRRDAYLCGHNAKWFEPKEAE